MSACEAFVGTRPRLLSNTNHRKELNHENVGLDIHPDTFAGGILQGRDPATAKIIHTSTQVPLPQLEDWARRYTTAEDILVMEASGNVFAVAARLKAIGRNAIVRKQDGGKGR